MHKNQVGLIKLKRFSPLVVKIQQFKFMKTLTYINFFLFSGTKYDIFCERNIFNL